MAFDYINYDEVDYIESDDKAYIDSGIKPNRFTIVEGRFSFVNTGYFFGVNSNGSGTGYYDLYNYSSTNQYYCRPIVSDNYPFTGRFPSGTIIDAYMNPKVKYELTDGTTVKTKALNISNTATCSRNMYILARNNQGSPTGMYQGNRCYYCKISDYDTGEVYKEFIPAKRKADDVVGLYDIVNEAFNTTPVGAYSYGQIVSNKQAYIKVNGVWKKGTPYIKVNGVWEDGTPYIKVNGDWR